MNPAATADPNISIIICAYTVRRLDDTLEAVRSVLTQTVKASHVIVSVDHNEELLRRLKTEVPRTVTVVLNDGAHGLSETRNVGVRTATGDIIVFLDDDAVAQRDWLENLVRAFEDPNVMAVGGESIPSWPSGKQPFWFPEEFDWTIGCTAHNKLMLHEDGEIRNVTGSNMAFRGEVFNVIGLWDTSLGAIGGKSRGGEEANICLRIKGGIGQSRIVYTQKAVASHKISPGRDTPGHLFRYCWDEGFNRARMRKVTAGFVKNPLSTETTFLRRLLTSSILRRLSRPYRVSNLAQVGAIVVSLMCMGTTFLLGRIKHS